MSSRHPLRAVPAAPRWRPLGAMVSSPVLPAQVDPLTSRTCLRGRQEPDVSELLSPSGSFMPFVSTRTVRHSPLLLSGRHALWIDPVLGSVRNAFGSWPVPAGTSLVGAIPSMDGLALLDAAQGMWLILSTGTSERPAQRPALALRGASDVARYGEVAYISLASSRTLVVVDASTLRVRRTFPNLFPAEPAALAVGPSLLYALTMRSSMTRQQPMATTAASGCDILLLDRHSRRSIFKRRLRLAPRCPWTFAPHIVNEEALVADTGGDTPCVRRVALQGNATARAVWCCDRPGCQLHGLVTNDTSALVLSSSSSSSSGSGSGSGSSSSRRMEHNTSTRLMTLTTLDSRSGQELRQTRVWLPSPKRTALGRQTFSRLLAPSYLATPVFRQLPLREKREPQRAALRRMDLPALGAVDIESLRAAVLAHWRELWEDHRHAFHFLFPGLQGSEYTFRNVSNAKLLFSGEAALLGPRVERLERLQAARRHKAQGKPPPTAAGAAGAAGAAAAAAAAGGRQSNVCLIFPGWRLLRPLVLPLLEEIFCRRLGIPCRELPSRVWRVQLNRMPAGSEIRPHIDLGSYAMNAHRVHIPLIVPSCLRFEQMVQTSSSFGGGGRGHSAGDRWERVPMRESLAFEIVCHCTSQIERAPAAPTATRVPARVTLTSSVFRAQT